MAANSAIEWCDSTFNPWIGFWLAQGWMVYGESRAFLRKLDDKQ